MPTEIERFLELGQVHKEWIDRYITASAFGNPPTLYATAALTFKVIEARTPGSLAECGVAAGVHPAVMHYVQRFCFAENRELYRRIYLFDSFEGIPRATAEDIPSEEHPGEDIRRCIGEDLAGPGPIKSTGIAKVTLEEVQRRMATWGADPRDLYYVVGWFQSTVPHTNTGQLAILRIDGDLYESTKVCLEHLYPNVVRGGFVIVDDWRLAGVRRAVDEYFGRTPRVHEVPGGDGPVFWRKA